MVDWISEVGEQLDLQVRTGQGYGQLLTTNDAIVVVDSGATAAAGAAADTEIFFCRSRSCSICCCRTRCLSAVEFWLHGVRCPHVSNQLETNP